MYSDKIQTTAFFMQEIIISNLYIYEGNHLLRLVCVAGPARHAMLQAISLNVIIVVIILLDIGLLSVEYKNLNECEHAFKGVVYSLKAKLAVAIFCKLCHARPYHIRKSHHARDDVGKGAIQKEQE